MPETTTTPRRDTAALIALAAEMHEPRIMTVTGKDGAEAEVLFTPKGFNANGVKPFLDAYLTAPERRKGTAHVSDLPSFIGHANRFADEDSALFASPDPKAPKLTAVLDYHRRGSDGAPRFGEHRVVYSFPVSEEFRLWTGADKKVMSQKDFAEFIENRLADVANPERLADGAVDVAKLGKVTGAYVTLLGGGVANASRLRELSEGLEVRVDEMVGSVVKLASGEAQVKYASTHKDAAGEPLRVPGLFLIAIPVFQFGTVYEIAARLRYRVKEGSITWFFELYRADAVFDDAFKGACEEASTGTKLPLEIGSPE